MRTVYHKKLAELSDEMGTICEMAGTAMERATQALLTADLPVAEQVINDREQVMESVRHAEESALSLIALQQPVAGELRAIASSLRIAADVDRMDALAVHIAKIARRRHPGHAVPDEVAEIFSKMGRVAHEIGAAAQEVLRTLDPERAARIRQEDDEMDDLHRQLFTVLMDRNGWQQGVPPAVDVALLGRFYERFADHAVEIGRRVVFEATGALPEEQEVGSV